MHADFVGGFISSHIFIRKSSTKNPIPYFSKSARAHKAVFLQLERIEGSRKKIPLAAINQRKRAQ